MASSNFFSADPFVVLGIGHQASGKEIKTAYRALALKWHPDKQPQDITESDAKHVQEVFAKIQEAFDLLREDAPSAFQAASGSNQNRVDPEDLSEKFKVLFAKARAKARGRHKNVVMPVIQLAAHIGGYKKRRNVAGDGNCAAYVIAVECDSDARTRAWPEEYNIEPFISPAAVEWWEKIGDEYRAGASSGEHIIAAAAVVRSRIPEEMCAPEVFQFGHSLDGDHLGALGKVLTMCFKVHAHMPRQPLQILTLGQTNKPAATIATNSKPAEGVIMMRCWNTIQHFSEVRGWKTSATPMAMARPIQSTL